MRDKYTKKGAPKEFKKLWKYDSLLNWALKYVEVVKAAKDARKEEEKVDQIQKELFDIQDEITHLNQCQDDLNVFGYESLKEQQEKIQGFIWRIEQNTQEKLIARQMRYTQFETKYFGLINAYKKKSMEAQKQA